MYHSTKAHSFTKTEICDILLIKRIKKDKNCEKYIIQKGYGFRRMNQNYQVVPPVYHQNPLEEKKMFFYSHKNFDCIFDNRFEYHAGIFGDFLLYGS